MLQLLGDKFGGGFYSPAVGNRQPALSSLANAITRTEARTHPPLAPVATPPAAVAQAVSKRAPGANANAAAFRLAALKIAAEHAGSAPRWPELARAAEAAQTSIG